MAQVEAELRRAQTRGEAAAAKRINWVVCTFSRHSHAAFARGCHLLGGARSGKLQSCDHAHSMGQTLAYAAPLRPSDTVSGFAVYGSWAVRERNRNALRNVSSPSPPLPWRLLLRAGSVRRFSPHRREPSRARGILGRRAVQLYAESRWPRRRIWRGLQPGRRLAAR